MHGTVEADLCVWPVFTPTVAPDATDNNGYLKQGE